jgi:hypothetical protein
MTKLFIVLLMIIPLGKEMGCWKWFSSVLKEAGVKVTDKNEDKVEEIIHNYIGEKAKYGQCSSDWTKAHKEINANEKLKQELVQRLTTIV